MKIVTIPYTSSFESSWENFVSKANNGTLFHFRKFLKYHPPDRFEDHSLVFKKENKVIALLPAAIRRDEGKSVLVSHPGASYGGLITQFHLGLRDVFDIVESFLSYVQAQAFARVEVTPPPHIYFHRPSHYLDFALIKNGFAYKKREISSVIPLTFKADEVLQTFIPEARTAVRRGYKLGVSVKPSSDFHAFYEILKSNLQLRHNVKPAHSLDELLLLKNIFPEEIQLLAAFVEKTMVAGVVTFACNRRVILAFYISHREDYQKFRGVNCLFDYIIRWSIEHGFACLDFGIFTVNMDPNWGLGKFKESFGAQGIFRDTFFKNF